VCSKLRTYEQLEHELDVAVMMESGTGHANTLNTASAIAAGDASYLQENANSDQLNKPVQPGDGIVAMLGSTLPTTTKRR